MRELSDDIRYDLLDILLRSTLDAVVAVDEAGVIVGWNAVAEKTFGWTSGEVIGRSMADIIVPPQHRSGHERGMALYQETGEARVINRRIEITAIDKNGREFPIELSIVETPPGTRAAFVGFLRDISDRKAYEEMLTLSEESLRLTTEAAEIGTWDLDLITNVLTWSDRTKAMFGISPALPCSMDDFYAGLHPEDRAMTASAFASALDAEARATYDVQFRTVGREDGLVRWVAAKGKGIFDDGGRCVRAVGTAIDITARKLEDAKDAFMLELSDLLRGADTDVALQSVSALMGRYFAVCRVGYGNLDPVADIFEYSVCWTDGTVEPLLGRFPARAFGRKIVAKLSAGETVVVNDLFEDSISDEEETRATASSVDTRSILVVPFLRAGLLRTIVYLNDRPARKWSTGEIAFMQDVAERTRQVIERREAEEALLSLNASLEERVEERTQALRSTEEALRQSQKMEAIGQLTGGIAHDFNNLLQGITGSLNLIQKRLTQGRTGELDRFIEGALASANRAAALTHRLLAFARRQPIDPQTVHVNSLVMSMADLLRRTLGETIELQLQLDGGLWLTRCDPNQLENAVLNLAINARDAMPDGGILKIETKNAASAPAGRSFSNSSQRAFVHLRISDTGVGMPPETVRRAFEPFFTTKPTGQGTGLGLSMIYGFVKQSDGFIEIDSEPGRGTAIDLFLPRSMRDDDNKDTSQAIEIAPSSPLNGTVLVVEDEPVVRSLITEVLSELGYHVLEAEDGPTGLAILQSDSKIDLLVTDIGLPGLNGRQVADGARVVRPDLKVLLMTGYAEVAAAATGFLTPGMALMTKPFEMDMLTARIKKLLEDD
jgi:PAS domain S-box-containing protein